MKTIFTIFILLCFTSIAAHSQGTWVQMSDFGGEARCNAVGFSIGDKGYIGTGGSYPDFQSQDVYNDFWEYNTITNVWTQKANVGGMPRSKAVGFSIGNKGYIGTGCNGSYTCYNDFWEYDPSSNQWTQKTNVGGGVRCLGVGFSIGNKGYIGTGFNGNYINDFWEYNPETNQWIQKANFSGGNRAWSVGFSIGNKGYIGTGWPGPNNDFWEYNPEANQWVQKASFSGSSREGAIGFSIGNKGYIGTGCNGLSSYYNDFYEYNPETNQWMQKSNFNGSSRWIAVSFSIGDKGYIGTGWNLTNGSLLNDFWVYSFCMDYAPILNSPANTEINVSLLGTVFTWEPVSSATSYTIQISITSDFSDNLIVYQSGLTNTTYTNNINLNYFTTYYWRVSASNSCGTNLWSETWSFTTECPTSKLLDIKLYMQGLWNGSNHIKTPLMLELRQGLSLFNSIVAARKSGIIDSSGHLIIDFSDTPDGNYWVIIRASGYMPLAIPNEMINLPACNGIIYDFTTSETQAVGTNRSMIEINGAWLMRAGDFNSSRNINTQDLNILLQNNGKNISGEVPPP